MCTEVVMVKESKMQWWVQCHRASSPLMYSCNTICYILDHLSLNCLLFTTNVFQDFFITCFYFPLCM